MRRFVAITATLCIAAAVAGDAKADIGDINVFQVPVSCSDTLTNAPDWAVGVYHATSNVVELQVSLCNAISKAVHGKMRDKVDVGMAALGVFMLGHELSHSLGTHDTNFTNASEDSIEPDCVAWILFPWVARKLSIPRKTELRLADKMKNRGGPACQALGLVPVGP